MASNWNKDLIIENSIRGYYTCPLFWSKRNTSYEVINDEERQRAGIDIICNNKNIDEKCSTYSFVNLPEPPSWLCEIGVPKKNNRNELTPGWSMQDNLTDYLFLMTISNYIGPTKFISGKMGSQIIMPNNLYTVPIMINELYCILEKKNVAIEFICNKCNITKNDLWNIICDMHQNGKSIYWLSNDIKITKVFSNDEQSYIIPLKLCYHKQIADKIFKINRWKGVI